MSRWCYSPARQGGDSGRGPRTSPRWKHFLTLTYLLTFNCYGTHLPGDERGWVDRTRGDHRGGYGETALALESHARERMRHAPYLLDERRGQVVVSAIQEVCTFRSWQLLAAHVRTTHVHCVVGGVQLPNRAIADFKVYASRALNRIEERQARWARGGNTRALPASVSIHAAVRYVADGQGEPMAVFVWHYAAEVV